MAETRTCMIDKYLNQYWGESPNLVVSMLPERKAADRANRLVNDICKLADDDGVCLDRESVAERIVDILYK